MWFMPSYGRPEALARMRKSPGGLPRRVIVLVNSDDPKADDYFWAAREWSAPWQIMFVPNGSRCADAHRYITTQYPDEKWYGLLCDDHWPVTPGWDKALVGAAGTKFISTPAGD